MNNRELLEGKKSENQSRPERSRAVDLGFPKEVPPELGEKWGKGCADFKLIGKAIGKSGRMVESGRMALSRGFCGPLFMIKTSAGPVVEKTFIVGRRRADSGAELGMRFRVDALPEKTVPEIKPRLVVLGAKENEGSQVIDWVYNEETALTALAGIPGIPKYITSVYNGTRGSVVEEYIDGYELSAICENAETAEEINNVFDRLRTAYTTAAEKGYLYNNVVGSTILVERTSCQPYLIDWYNHSAGDIKNAAGPAHERFARGLEEIERCRKETLARFADEYEKRDLEKE
jgi:hypothetical protein